MFCKTFTLIGIIFTLHAFTFCQSPKKSKALQNTEEVKNEIDETKRARLDTIHKIANSNDLQRTSEIGPDDIRVIATLILTHAPGNAESPCDQFACIAEIRIEEIVQRGRTYSGVIESGQTLVVFFPMTLEKTSKVFSGQGIKQYAGLNKGDRFLADIEGSQALDDLKSKIPQVLTYELFR